MESMFAKIVLSLSLSYTAEVPPKYDSLALYSPQELTEEAKKETNLQILANTLYHKMGDKDNILALFFESYGEKDLGFYVEKNFANEKKYLIFHADHQQQGKTAVIKISGEFQNLESVTLKKVKGTEIIKEDNVSPDDNDALLLYRRMLETSVEYIDNADVTKHPIVGNFAKYNEFIEDDKFILSLENLISKTGI